MIKGHIASADVTLFLYISIQDKIQNDTVYVELVEGVKYTIKESDGAEEMRRAIRDFIKNIWKQSGGSVDVFKDSNSWLYIEQGTIKTENYIVSNAEKITDDIININKKYSNGNQMNNSIANIINSASYYESPYDQAASITRSITQHAFENGNKRTAFDVLNILIRDMNLECTLNDAEK